MRTHYNQTFKNQSQRENFESSKKEKAVNLQGNHHKAIIGFLNRYLARKNRVRMYTKNAGRKSANRDCFSQQKHLSEMKDRLGNQKTIQKSKHDGVYNQENCFTRNVEGSSSS